MNEFKLQGTLENNTSEFTFGSDGIGGEFLLNVDDSSNQVKVVCYGDIFTSAKKFLKKGTDVTVKGKLKGKRTTKGFLMITAVASYIKKT